MINIPGLNDALTKLDETSDLMEQMNDKLSVVVELLQETNRLLKNRSDSDEKPVVIEVVMNRSGLPEVYGGITSEEVTAAWEAAVRSQKGPPTNTGPEA